MKDTHSKSPSIEQAGWALKVMLTIIDSWESLEVSQDLPNRGHHGSSNIGKSFKDTTVRCYTLHTTRVGLLRVKLNFAKLYHKSIVIIRKG